MRSQENNIRTLLMIAYPYPPGSYPGTFRVLRLTRFLPEFGWHCVVVTPLESCHAVREDDLIEQIHPDTEIHRFACGDPVEHLSRWLGGRGRGKSFVTRAAARVLSKVIRIASVPDSGILGVRRLRRTVMEVIRGSSVDAVWLTAPNFSCFCIVPELKRKTNIPVVLDLRDPWSTSPVRYLGWNRWKRGIERRREERIFERADRIVLNTTYACREYQALYPGFDERKWSVVPNGYDPEDFVNVAPERFPQRVLLHAGRSGGVRTARWLIEAMGRLRSEGLIGRDSFRYISYGSGGQEEHEAAAATGVTDMVEFRGTRPHREVLAAMKGADALLLMVGQGHDASTPSKLFEYLAAGRPVLMTGPPGCAAADVIRDTNVGVAVAHDDVNGLVSALRDLVVGEKTGCRGNQGAIRAYESRSVAAALSTVLEATIAEAGATNDGQRATTCAHRDEHSSVTAAGPIWGVSPNIPDCSGDAAELGQLAASDPSTTSLNPEPRGSAEDLNDGA